VNPGLGRAAQRRDPGAGHDEQEGVP